MSRDTPEPEFGLIDDPSRSQGLSSRGWAIRVERVSRTQSEDHGLLSQRMSECVERMRMRAEQRPDRG
jgi:hypothetical protein